MDERDLHRQVSSDDDRSTASGRGRATGTGTQGLRFEEESTDASLSEANTGESALQHLKRHSKTLQKEISDTLSTTDESDEDSFKDRPFRAAGVPQTAGVSAVQEPPSMLAMSRQKQEEEAVAETRRLHEKVRLLLADRKKLNDQLTAQRAELDVLRAGAAKAGAEDPVVLKSQIARQQEEISSLQRRVQGSASDIELLAEVNATRTENEALKRDLAEKSASLRQLELKVEGLVRENAAQTRTIELQNAKITRLSGVADVTQTSVVSTKQRGGDSSFEADFAALDAALGHIDSTVSKTSPLTPEQKELADLRQKVSQRDEEIAQLQGTVKRLEVLAFDQSNASSDIEGAGARGVDDETARGMRLLRETNTEQAATIQLQKSTIANLKEQVELLTRQVGDFHNDNAANVEKVSRERQQLRLDIQRHQEEKDKLARDKEEFAKHLRQFKDARKEVLQGTTVVTVGGGVSKQRYRALRTTRDKYKRKDYRKGKDISAMQKRLLQNVELVEVDDSQQSSSEGSNQSQVSNESSKRSVTSSQASRSVQVVHDSSSEHGDEEE